MLVSDFDYALPPERIAQVPPEYRTLCAGARQKCRYIWRIPEEKYEH